MAENPDTSGSSTPAVNGVYTIPAGASLTLVLGGTGYRPAILRKLTLDSPSADFALCTVTFSTPSTGKSFQLGTNYPARAFAPGSFNTPQLHVAINSTVTTNCIVTNGGAAAVALTVGVELN